MKQLVYLVSGGISKDAQGVDPPLLVEQAYGYALQSLGMNMDTAVPLMDGIIISFMPPVPDDTVRVTERIGLSSVRHIHIPDSEAAGGACFHEAVKQILSDEMDIVLACGWRTGTSLSNHLRPIAHDAISGITPEQLAMVSVKNHCNAAHNPYAQSSTNVAVCILASEAGVRRIQKRGRLRHPVIVSGVGYAHADDESYPFNRQSLLRREAISQAYAQAGNIKRPLYELDFVELHDCNTLSEIKGYEDMGLCAQGEAGTFLDYGFPFLDSVDYGKKVRPFPQLRNVAVNPSGGLIACDYAGAATSLRQTVFSFWQIQQTIAHHFGSSTLQVPNARRCAIYSQSETGNTVTVSVLQR